MSCDVVRYILQLLQVLGIQLSSETTTLSLSYFSVNTLTREPLHLA